MKALNRTRNEEANEMAQELFASHARAEADSLFVTGHGNTRIDRSEVALLRVPVGATHLDFGPWLLERKLVRGHNEKKRGFDK